MTMSDMYLRSGTIDFLKSLKEGRTRCFVVSAGIRAAVAETFYLVQLQESVDLGPSLEFCMTPEVYQPDGTIAGFAEPFITAANKNVFVTHQKFPEIMRGANGIVMGDLIEDLNIVTDLELGTKIKIGFYNPDGPEKESELAKYKESFDIVFAGDGNMTNVGELFRMLVGLPRDAKTYRSHGPSATEFDDFLDSCRILH